MRLPIPVNMNIAPAGWSWHGPSLQQNTYGLPCNPNVSFLEHVLLEALERIVLEAMQYSPVRHVDSYSYLPQEFIEMAQRALAVYGMRVQPSQVVMA